MTNTLFALLDRMIPEAIRNSQIDKVRSQLLVGILAIDVAILFVFILMAITVLPFSPDVLKLSLGFTLTLFSFYSVVLLFFIKTGNHMVASHCLSATLMLAIFSAMHLTGGFSQSPMTQLVLLVPLTAFLLLGSHGGVTWLVISLLGMAVALVLSLLDIGYLDLFSAEQSQLMNQSLYFFIFFMVAGAVIIYESINEDLKIRLYIEKNSLAHQASHDALTGIPNRPEFLRRLDQALVYAAQSNSRVVLIYIDLDGFKPVNDTYGHHAGDVLLQAIAKRLQSAVRSSDTAARLGGDEFALILVGVSPPADIRRITDNILSVIRQPVEIGNGQQVVVRGSLGAASFPDDSVTGEELCIQADTAMYRAKEIHDTCVFFSEMESRA